MPEGKGEAEDGCPEGDSAQPARNGRAGTTEERRGLGDQLRCGVGNWAGNRACPSSGCERAGRGAGSVTAGLGKAGTGRSCPAPEPRAGDGRAAGTGISCPAPEPRASAADWGSWCTPGSSAPLPHSGKFHRSGAVPSSGQGWAGLGCTAGPSLRPAGLSGAVPQPSSGPGSAAGSPPAPWAGTGRG